MSEPRILCSECFDAAGFEQVRGIRPRSICAKCGRECLGYGADEAEKSELSVPLSAIRALVQRWEKEIVCYESGVTLPTPVGDMNYASASTARKFLTQLAALCPAPPEDQP